METRTTAKDFFLHLGAIAGLYAVAIALVNLLFTVINKAYPTVSQYDYGYYYNSSGISLPVATLIINFPIFLLLSRLVHKTYEVEPDKKHLGIRRWLTYITLFVAGIILASDLVTVLYKFLDGQDLTMAFVLKALTVFILTGAIFKFYLDEIRDKVSGSARKTWVVLSTAVILLSIIFGFLAIGSPMTQRLLRYDNQKVSDLQNIQWQIVSHWQRTGAIPSNLSKLSDPISGFVIPKDPQSAEEYEYKKTGNNSFELCADFNKDSTKTGKMSMSQPYLGMKMNENWIHGMGRHCFTRTIDATLYPIDKMPIPIR